VANEANPKTVIATQGKTPALIIYGFTIFLSAALLFSIQPLLGKILLPLLGGAPAVWNTVMVFFQAMLLAGYAYSHFSVQKLGLRVQPYLQVVLIMVAALLLPFSTPDHDAFSSKLPPSLWVLVALFKTIALPVFVLASTAPLLQKWFSQSNHPSAKDPYFLYSASNLGSFGSLFAYPLLMEPLLRIQEQRDWWSRFFWIYCVFMAGCAFFTRNFKETEPRESRGNRPLDGAAISTYTKLKWIGLSFVPSSLMLGVTNYITTDVASIPLLWVIPLALYLFTFVIAFGKPGKSIQEASARSVPILALALVFPMLVQATEPVIVLVLLHLFFFFFATLRCHLRLANSRPDSTHLTSFYLFLSLGGVLGGIFNALLAPFLFDSILEYPFMILVATIIGFPERGDQKSKTAIRPIYGSALVISIMTVGSIVISLAARSGIILGNILAGIFLLGTYFLIRTPIRYSVAIGTLLICTSLFRHATSNVIERDRNFFGVLRVVDDSAKPLRRLFHGTTIHGVQFRIPERRCEPLSYYHTEGPVADIAELFEKTDLPRNVGLIGLGAGAMISYSKPGQNWTLYEIDPAVVRIAEDTNYFTYLKQCAKAPYEIKLGDARLGLDLAPNNHFGVIYLDAFSSDVIPIHLLTVEAVRLYQRKLAPGGILGFHLSSRHFELEPLVANLAQSVGLLCFESTRGELTNKGLEEGGLQSNWVVLVPESLLSSVAAANAWKRVLPDPKAPLWKDDFSNLIGVLRF
jgi:hypothetical protein